MKAESTFEIDSDCFGTRVVGEETDANSFAEEGFDDDVVLVDEENIVFLSGKSIVNGGNFADMATSEVAVWAEGRTIGIWVGLVVKNRFVERVELGKGEKEEEEEEAGFVCKRSDDGGGCNCIGISICLGKVNVFPLTVLSAALNLSPPLPLPPSSLAP